MNGLRLAMLAMLLCACGGVAAQETAPRGDAIDPRKAAVIHELLETTGAIDLSNKMVAGIIESQKQAHPEVDAAIWNRMAEKLDVNDLLGSIIAIYDRHFSLEDLQATVAFYKTPAGQRLIRELPAAMGEAMAAGQVWGQRKAAELVRELQDEEATAKQQTGA